MASSECICGDGDGIGLCFGVKGYSDECKACLALPPGAPCLGPCTCGSPDAYSLNPAEVVVHGRGFPCYIAPSGDTEGGEGR